MATVELTRHLVQFFPQLANDLTVDGATVADVVAAVEKVAPGFAFYVCDERGRLRRHVNVFVDGLSVGDRNKLSDPVTPTSQVLIMQALSGG
ncbi:MAG: MoaD/ThiS family protein [Kofleriaceae bacterium]